MVRDQLILDHFSVGLSDEQFRAARALDARITGWRYSEVASGKDAWRGCYHRANINTYFEMVERSAGYTFGIASSARQPFYVDARNLVREMAALPWKVGKRLYGKSKKTWFDYYLLKDRNLDRDPAYKKNHNWVMRYHLNHSPNAPVPVRNAIDRFERVVLRAGAAHLPWLRFHAQWLPGTQSFTRKLVHYEMPNRDLSPFHFEIEIVPGKSPVEFVQLEGVCCEAVPPFRQRTGPLRVTMRGSRYRLSAAR